MKTASILFMILGILMVLGFGFMYLLGFAMSFDAPGSTSDPAAWWMRFLMFLPILIMIGALIFAMIAFARGNYKQSFIASVVPVGIFILIIGFMFISSFASMNKYKAQMAAEAEDARLYPVQKFLRHVEGGTDTIIVFPNRIVAYRKYLGTNIPWGGPLGDLNEKRDTIYYYSSHDTKIGMGELDQFTDENGRKFTDVFNIVLREHTLTY
jgi:ABC-type transport system involved in multi-copper enzyme maturation permease subunit